MDAISAGLLTKEVMMDNMMIAFKKKNDKRVTEPFSFSSMLRAAFGKRTSFLKERTPKEKFQNGNVESG